MEAKLSEEAARDQRAASRSASPIRVAAVVLIAIVLYAPLLSRQGFFSHEDATPYYRVLEYVGEIRDGHWLPQTFPRVFKGAGHAFPRFYAPIGNWIAVAMTFATGDVVVGVHASFLLSVVCSALAMYALLMAWSGDRTAAFVGALAYVGIPYRFENVFIRGALAEGWAFVWYPLILLGLWRTKTEGRVPMFLPFVLAGLVLTHPVMTLYFAVVALALSPLWLPTAERRAWTALALAGLAALGLSAWSWLPQQYYLPTVWASIPSAFWADPAHVEANRVPLQTVLTGLPKRNGLNLSVGWLALAAHLLVLRAWLQRSRTADRNRLEVMAGLLLVPWWLLLLFLMQPGPFLSVLPRQFGYIQFPWRVVGLMGLLAVASFGCSFAATRERWVRVAGILAVVIVIARAGISPSVIPAWTSQYLEQQMAQGRKYGLTGNSEYLPRSVPGAGGDYYGALEALLARVAAGPRATPGVRVDSVTRHGSAADLVAVADVPGTVVLPMVYYDFYTARLADGAGLAVRDSVGLLALDVPAGRHAIAVREGLTTVTWIGLAISLGTLILLGGHTWLRYRGTDGEDSSVRWASSS
jgi:hypothetical protein